MKVFKEEQRFTQIWIILLIGLSTIIPLIFMIKEYTSENSTMSAAEFFGVSAAFLLFLFFFFLLKLKTRIDEKGIQYQFFPLQFKPKVISWNEIEDVHIRKYNAISEYGGWGIKGGSLWNKSKGIAYNVSGNIGIQILEATTAARSRSLAQT